MDNMTEKLEKIVKKNNIYQNEPMYKHTSFKIGGNVDHFVKIESEEELKNILHLAKMNEIPFFIIGNGTNLLIREGGIRGLVLKLEQSDYTIKKQGEFAYLTAQSGISLACLSHIACENGLTGLEGMSGIPGTLRWCC